MRASRFAFSTLLAPWLVALVLAVDVGIATMRSAPYLGEAMWTVRWMALGLWIVWALVAACAAVDAARYTVPGYRQLALAGNGPPRQYLWAWAWGAGPAGAVHAAVTLALLILGRAYLGRVGVAPLALAVLAQAATIAWFAALGSFLGRLCSPLLAGVVATVVAIVAGFALTDSAAAYPRFALLGDSGASVSQIGVSWNTSHLWWQLGLLAVTAIAMLWPRPSVKAGRLVPTWRHLGAVCVLVAALLMVPQVKGAPLSASAEPPDVCLGELPTVCVYREHAPYAGDTLAVLDHLMATARDAGYAAFIPQRIDEVSLRYNGADGGGTLALWTVTRAPVDPGELVYSLLMPTWCDALHDETSPPPDAYWSTQDALAATWLAIAGYTDPGSQPLSPAQVEDIMGAWAECDLSATSTPR